MRRHRRRSLTFAPVAEILELRRLLATSVTATTANAERPTGSPPSGEVDGVFQITSDTTDPISFNFSGTATYGTDYTAKWYDTTGMPQIGSSGTGTPTFTVTIVPLASSDTTTKTVVISIYPARPNEPGQMGQTTATVTIGPGSSSAQPSPVSDQPVAAVFTIPCQGYSTANPGKDTSNDPSLSRQASTATQGGTNASNGTVVVDPVAFTSDGFGQTWGLITEWTNADTASGGTFGNGMINPFQPVLQRMSGGNIRSVGSAMQVNWYKQYPNSPAIALPFFGHGSLSKNNSSVYIELAPDGRGETYYSFDPSVPAAQQGKLASMTDAYGNVTTAVYDSTTGLMTQEYRTDGTNSEYYDYHYITSGVNQGLVDTVTFSRSEGGGAKTVVRTASFTYYDGTQSYGGARDLEFERISDSGGNLLDTTYYRYYTSADAGSNGYVDGLKYVFQSPSYARLFAKLGDPTTLSDSQVAPYADNYYEYDSSHRVTKALDQGDGCTCNGSTGQGAYGYTYTASTNADGYNSWKNKTIETLPDGNQIYYYTNSAGELLLKAENIVSDNSGSGLATKLWATAYRYDASAQLIQTAEPSAVTITSMNTLTAAEANPDLVGYNASNNTYQYLAANAGRIDLITYGTSTEPSGNLATATTAGDAVGYVQADSIQNGTAGTPIMLDGTKYIQHTDGSGNVIYEEASHTVYRNTDGSGGETTSYGYTWFQKTAGTDTSGMSAMITYLPVIATGQNGTGSAAANPPATVYDSYGRAIWTRDEDGYIDYYVYDNNTGAVTKQIIDVNTSQTGNFANLPQGWATPAGGGLNLTSTYYIDNMGRVQEQTDPVGNATWWVYLDADHEVRTYHGWNSVSGTTTGPIEVTREDRANSYVETLTMSTSTPGTKTFQGALIPSGTESIANSAIQSMTRILINSAGQTVEEDDYLDIRGGYTTSEWIGNANSDYYQTFYGYDKMGRLAAVTDAVGTIRITKYDPLGRAAGDFIGTNMTGFYNSDGGASTGSNMQQIAAYTYDYGQVGDGDLTQVTTYVGANNQRVAQYVYDWRDRLVAAKAGVQASEDSTTHRPIVVMTYDNLDEVLSVAQYDGDGIAPSPSEPMGRLRAYSTYAYDDLGELYQQTMYSVDQTHGTISSNATLNSLVTSIYYDRRGDAVAAYAPGGLVTKVQYDGAGRVALESATDGAGGAAWANAQSTAGDHVLSQTRTTYDGDDNPILVVSADRYHDAATAATGDLITTSNAPALSSNVAIGRLSYSTAYYDAADRLTAAVDLGTNGGAAYTRPSAPPSRSDTALVTSYTYDNAGRLFTVTDPRGLVTQNTYDFLGRVTQSVAGYNAAINNGQPTTSANATSQYTYDGIDDVLTVTALQASGTPSQTTTYIYGVTTGSGSGVNDNDWLRGMVQPDKNTGAAGGSAYLTLYAYSGQGELIAGEETATSDPNGSVHQYTYDSLGRQTSDAVTTLASNVDGAVRRLDTAYDGAGRAYLFTSYADTAGQTVANQVEDTYNGLGQLTSEYEDHGAAVNTSATPAVNYAYSEMNKTPNSSRLIKMVYPNGRAVDYTYNSGLDNSISRVSSIADDSGGNASTTLEGYSYLGLDQVVARNHPQSGVNLTYIRQAGDASANGDGGDEYTGLDRFGRVIDQNWTKSGGGSAARYQYGYDRDGDVLYRADLVNTALSELYHANSSASGDNNTAYDALGRLTSFSRGTLSSSGYNGTGPDTVSTATASSTQSWQLDALGNWTSTTKNNSTTTQTFNADNQVSSTGYQYDNNGNLLTSPGRAYTYDAWNRLKTVTNTTNSTPLASYAYDALGRRVVEVHGATVTHVYFTPNGQAIEERVGGTATSNVTTQYVYGVTGNMVLRDSYSGGTIQPSARLYVLTDANGDTMALVNTAGAVVQRYVYDPYGTVTVLGNNGSPQADVAGMSYLFQGGRLDTATGMYVFGYRDYDPTQGRWEERDPLGLAAGDNNIYRFVGNNPIDLTDPSGLDWWDTATSSLQLVGGGLEVAAGAGIAATVGWTGIGLLPAGALGLHGADTFWAGASGLWNGESQRTVTAQAVTATASAAGLSPGAAAFTGDVVDGAIPLVAGGAGSVIANRAKAAALASKAKTCPAPSSGPSPRTPVGRSGQQHDFPNPNAPQPRNPPTTINGRDYSGHAIDRMQERGFVPSVVENAMKTGVPIPGNTPGTTVFTDTVNKFRVIVNSVTGKVITIIPGV